jgi:hypothetical protein
MVNVQTHTISTDKHDKAMVIEGISRFCKLQLMITTRFKAHCHGCITCGVCLNCQPTISEILLEMVRENLMS